MKVSFVVALLVASIAGATAQGTLAPTPPPAQPPVMNGTFNVDNIPVGPVPVSLYLQLQPAEITFSMTCSLHDATLIYLFTRS